MSKKYCVYILSNENKRFYIGITSDLVRRIWEHRNAEVFGHAKKYNKIKLVYFEVFDDPENAIKREKRLKRWNRAWKIKLIEEKNPDWNDLYDSLFK